MSLEQTHVHFDSTSQNQSMRKEMRKEMRIKGLCQNMWMHPHSPVNTTAFQQRHICQKILRLLKKNK